MKLLKSFIIGLSLAFSLGFIPTTVIAAGPPTSASTLNGINTVLEHVSEAIKAIDAKVEPNEVREHIKVALRNCKEITGKESMEKKRLKYSRLLKKARTEIKNGYPDHARELLVETHAKFESLKKLI
jgi:hypothetical protein